MSHQSIRVALFVPCYVDQFYPQVGKAALQLLEKCGCTVDYPDGQTCCGQPLANSGMEQAAKPIYHHFVETFGSYDYIVVPSASCAYHVSHHYDVIEQTTVVKKVRESIYDITAFLTDVLHIESLAARFPHKVGIHQSCHGLRGLQLARSTEQMIDPYSKWEHLLHMVGDLELVQLERPDECCGFGGTFAVAEEAVSAKMGKDRVQDHLNSGAEFITSGDMSCLMHMEGLIRRNKWPIQVKHLVEILNTDG